MMQKKVYLNKVYGNVYEVIATKVSGGAAGISACDVSIIYAENNATDYAAINAMGVQVGDLVSFDTDQVALEIDTEVRKIIDSQYQVTKKILEENKSLLELIANTLLEYETITKEQIEYLVEHGCMPDEDKEVDYSDFEELSYKDMNLKELKELAKEKGIKGYSKMSKEEIIDSLNKDAE